MLPSTPVTSPSSLPASVIPTTSSGATPSPSPLPNIVVHTATSGVPWWAVPIVGGIFALIGVGIAQSVSVRLDRGRRAREDERRLDAPLREASLKYLAALQSYATFVTSLTVGELLITGLPSILEHPSEFDRWSECQHEIDDALALLSLAAPADLLTQAGAVHEPSYRFNIAAQKQPITERLKYQHADEIYNLIPAYRNAVRKHLGLEPIPERRANLASRFTRPKPPKP